LLDFASLFPTYELPNLGPPSRPIFSLYGDNSRFDNGIQLESLRSWQQF